MGSAQSRGLPSDHQQERKADATTNDTSSEEKDPKENELSGMPLVHYKCRKRKKRYDRCTKQWYNSQFMTDKISMDQEEACGGLFEAYKTCVLKGIKKEVWEKQGLPPPLEGSALAELAEEEEADR